MHRVLSRIAVPLAAASAMLVAVPAYADNPGTYGKNDAGGFRNVLPPGQNGLDTLGQILNFRATGALPKHWADQQPLYDGLLYASPTLTDSQVNDYYKDATFGVKKKNRAKTVKPRKGVTILRDKQYGVPRVYGKTRSDTMFGAGYASANDRLFLMDVLRHTGRADLTNFLGGGNLNADANQWQNNAYTEADLKRMLKAPAQGSLKEWKKLRKDVTAYVKGINAYIKAARKNDALLPGEYAAVGQKLKKWKATDVMAVATLFGGIFGRGGGAEVTSAEILRALEARFGVEQGRAIWTGFRSKNNPTAPTTIPESFPYQTGDSFAPKGLALPDPGTSVTPWKVISGRHVKLSACSRRRQRVRGGCDPERATRRAPLELGTAFGQELGQRPAAGCAGAAGRLLPAPGADGTGTARSGHRRPRRRIPWREHVRTTWTWPRLRVERDVCRFGQRGHLRGGALRRQQVQIQVQGQVPQDGEAGP